MLTVQQLQQVVKLSNELNFAQETIFHVKRVVQRAISKGYNNDIIALCWLHNFSDMCESDKHASLIIDQVRDIDKLLAKDLEILNKFGKQSLRAHLLAISNSAYPRIVKCLCIADSIVDVESGEERNIYLEYFGKFLEKMDGYTIN